MTARQSDLFGFKKPRVKPQFRAHIIDAGAGYSKPQIGLFKCHRCHWESRWIEFDTVTEGKRGIPCPVCNKGDA